MEDERPVDPRPAIPSFSQFCAEVCERSGLQLVDPTPADQLVRDLGMDLGAMFTVSTVVGAMNPHFELPDQMDLDDLTLGDIYHYFIWMDAGYREPHV